MVLLGELSLDDHLRHASGVLPLMAMCSQAGVESAVVPADDLAEAQLMGEVRVFGLETLA